ncbi:hypothetical protein HDV02_004933 [Globomyces sp. JEL0801]|nr:hypothetical protein HDV02_004933 [Globomyces sp. JEL0801]
MDSHPSTPVTPISRAELENQLIGTYKIIRFIGAGSYATVFLAEDCGPTKCGQVAIKITKRADKEGYRLLKHVNEIFHHLETTIFSETSFSPITAANRNERYGKDNVIRYIDTIETDLYLCTVMEYINGMELFDYIMKYHKKIESISIGVEDALAKKIMRDLLQAHGDIKLENILVVDTPSPTIKLIDFGLAQIVNTGNSKPARGSDPYLSPEIVMQLPVQDIFKCDIWALGVVLFALMTGRMPFDVDEKQRELHHGLNEFDLENRLRRNLLRKIAMGSYKYSESESSNIQPDVKDLISKMLCRNANDRLNAEDCLNHKWFSSLNVHG